MELRNVGTCWFQMFQKESGGLPVTEKYHLLSRLCLFDTLIWSGVTKKNTSAGTSGWCEGKCMIPSLTNKEECCSRKIWNQSMLCLFNCDITVGYFFSLCDIKVMLFVPLWHHSWLCFFHYDIKVVLFVPLWHHRCIFFVPLWHHRLTLRSTVTSQFVSIVPLWHHSGTFCSTVMSQLEVRVRQWRPLHAWNKLFFARCCSTTYKMFTPVQMPPLKMQ